MENLLKTIWKVPSRKKTERKKKQLGDLILAIYKAQCMFGIFIGVMLRPLKFSIKIYILETIPTHSLIPIVILTDVCRTGTAHYF